jgi:hypothetical protein
VHHRAFVFSEDPFHRRCGREQSLDIRVLSAQPGIDCVEKPFMNCIEAFVLTIVVAGCYLMVSPM